LRLKGSNDPFAGHFVLRFAEEVQTSKKNGLPDHYRLFFSCFANSSQRFHQHWLEVSAAKQKIKMTIYKAFTKMVEKINF